MQCSTIKRMPRNIGVALWLATLTTAGPGLADADGPDAWRVVDVAPDDALNARMGPGTRYKVIGAFAHDARGLVQITCVPLRSGGIYWQLTAAERAALPPRWCLMQSPDYSLKGWVAQRYLAEDSTMPAAGQGVDSPTIAAALELVERLYRDHARALRDGAVTSPLNPSRARDFLVAPLAAKLAQRSFGADPLFDAQDTDISDLRISPDPDQPVLRGMITVNVDFRNFGRWHRSVLRLRHQNGAPRVIRIEHPEWQIE
jgi:hypothetical protein